MQLKFFIIFFLLELTILYCYSDVDESHPFEEYEGKSIRKIEFEGNRLFSQKQLLEQISYKPDSKFSQSDFNSKLNVILESYRKGGALLTLLRPKFELSQPDQLIIKIEVDEGEVLKIGEVEISGNAIIPKEELSKALRVKKGAPLSSSSMEAGIQNVLNLYSEIGYPLAKIVPTDFQLDKNNRQVNMRLEIDEGEKIKISKIGFEGLTKTKEHVIHRELPIKSGELYNQNRIDQSYQRLNNLGYFYYVEPIKVAEAEKPDEVSLLVQVLEAKTGRFNGVIGYAPPESESDSPRLTGVIEASDINFLGRGRNIGISWKSGILESYRFNFEEPWAFGKPFKIGFELSGLKQKDRFTEATARESSGSLIFTAKLIEWISGSMGVTYKRINISEAPILTGAKSGSRYGLSFNFYRDSRDYFLNPTVGRFDKMGWEISRGDFKFHKIWVDSNQYFKTASKQLIAFGAHFATVNGKNLPPTELLYLGGSNTLRGYNEDWFRGSRRFFVNLEYRILSGRNSHFFGFIDLGSVSQVKRTSKFEPIKVGYGVGTRIESKGGLISLDYGLASGDSVLQGKIHISLGANF